MQVSPIFDSVWETMRRCLNGPVGFAFATALLVVITNQLVSKPATAQGITYSLSGKAALLVVSTYQLASKPATAQGITYALSGKAAKSATATPAAVAIAALSGTLTPASPSCTIAAGASSCNVTLTWTTTNPVGVSAVTSNTPNANTLIGSGNNGTASASVPQAGRTFFLYNNGVLLDTSVATATCASGTTWNGSVCGVNQPTPTLNSVTPLSTPVPNQQFTARLVGTNFNTSTVEVVVNGPGCNNCVISNNVLTNKSATQVDAPFTLGAGTYQVQVRNGSVGQLSNLQLLTVNNPQQPDFSISVSPLSRTVTRGQSTTYTVSVQSINGFSGQVTLNVKNLPGNIVGCTAFQPSPVTVPANGTVTSTLTLCTTNQSPLGTFTNLFVEGQGNGLTRNSPNFSVTVQNAGDFTVAVTPSSRTVTRGQSTTYTVTVTSQNGFSGQVTLNVKNLPGNIVGCTAFQPPTVNVPANGSATSTLTLCTTAQSPLGTFSNLFIEGASGNLVRNSPTFGVTITEPLAPTLNPPALSCAAVTLSWSRTNAVNFSAYRLYRGTVSGVAATGTPLATFSNRDSLQFTDTTLANGQSYFYRVFVVTTGSEFLGSNEQRAQRTGGNAPMINSSAPTMATVGRQYSYSVQATDAEGDPLRYRLVTGPTGVQLNDTTGLLTWVPGATQTGPQRIALRVSDGCNESALHEFTVNVINSNDTGTGCEKTRAIGGLSFRADCIQRVDANTQRLSGNVSLNNFLRFDGDLTLRQNGVIYSVSGSGAIFIDGIPGYRSGLVFRGSYTFTLDGGAALTNFVRSQIGEQLELAGMRVEIQNLFVLTDGLRVEGNLTLPSIAGFVARISTLQITRSSGLRLDGELRFPTIRLTGQASLENVVVRYSNLDGMQFFSGNAGLRTPLLSIEAGADIKMGCLNRVGLEVESNSAGIPLLTTGLKISGGKVELNNLCGGPFSITLGVDITTVDPVVSRYVKLDDLILTYTLPRMVAGSGKFKIFDRPVSSGSVRINDPAGIKLEANANLANMINGDFKLSIEPPQVVGSVDADVTIPKIDGDSRVTRFILSRLPLPYRVGQVGAGFKNDEISFKQSLAGAEVTVKLKFLPNTTLPRIEVAGNWKDFLPGFTAEPVDAQITPEQFAKEALRLGFNPHLVLPGVLLEPAQQQSVNLPGGVPQALFSLQGRTRVPDFTLIAPDGRRITPTTTGTDIQWAGDNQTFTAFYLVNTPASGRWAAETSEATAIFNVALADSPSRIAVNLSPNTAPDAAVAAATAETAATIAIQWTAFSPNPEARVSLFYDTDNRGNDGHKIVEGLTVANTSQTYNWTPTNVPSGDYYIYAVIEDGRSAPLVAYSTTPVAIDAAGAPAQPRNFTLQASENSIGAAWQANQEPDVAGYLLSYSSDLGSTDYDRSVNVGLVTSFRLSGLEPRRQYRVTVAAYNTNGQVSRRAEPRVITTGDSQPPVVRVTSPNGGELLFAGKSFTIQWQASDNTSITAQQILLSSDGGTSYPLVLADNLAGSARSFVWTLPPELRTNNLRIRVVSRDEAGNLGKDESDTNFASRALAPQFAPLNPNSIRTTNQPLSLLLQGQNFASGAVVIANRAGLGEQRLVSTFANDTQLTAVLPAILLSSSGTVSLAVENPDTQRSEVQTLTVTASAVAVSAASFSGNPLASESIAAVFGSGLSTATQAATSVPLPTTLAGTTVKVRDSAGTERAAPLFFVSAGQINLQIPEGTKPGIAAVAITASNGAKADGAIEVTNVAPGLFAANANGQGVPAAVALRVRANGTQVTESVSRFDPTTNRYVPVPIDLGPPGERVFLILFGTGIRFRSAPSAVTVTIGGVNAAVSFAGKQGALVGLDQVNVEVPRTLAGRGEIDLMLTVDGKAANTVRVAIK